MPTSEPVLEVCLFVALTLLLAGQLDFDTRRRGGEIRVETSWTGPARDAHEVSYTLDRSAVLRAREARSTFPWSEYIGAQVAAVEAYAAGYPEVQITAQRSSSGRGLSINVKGRAPRPWLEQRMAEAREVADAAAEAYQERHAIVEVRPGLLRPDHVRVASEAVREVRPLALALKRQAGSETDFLRLALSFVQSMPYEKKESFRPPLSALVLNKGDCESKSVLYLALVRAAYPRLDVAMVYVHEHTYVAVALDQPIGSTSVRAGGRVWTAIEPVGPGLFEVGELGPDSHSLPIEDFEVMPR